MKKLIFITVAVGIILTGCGKSRESDDARRINEYFANKGINEKVDYINRVQAVNGIFRMLFQDNYFQHNPETAADLITKLEYYEVVFNLEHKLMVFLVEDRDIE